MALDPTLVQIEGYVWLQDIGAVNFFGNEYAGTRNEGRRMEGFEISLVNPPGTLALVYRAYVEDITWMNWVSGGTYAGTQGQSRRCEAFVIELTGDTGTSGAYTVEYMAHQENFGDIGPYYDSQICGNEGLGLRLEGLAVSIVQSPLVAADVSAKSTA